MAAVVREQRTGQCGVRLLCVSITSADVVTLATCGNESPAQTWTLYANGTLEPQSVPGEFLAVCTSGAVGCDSKIMELISNDGQMMTIAADTDDTAASEGWEEIPPSEHLMSNSDMPCVEAVDYAAPSCMLVCHCMLYVCMYVGSIGGWWLALVADFTVGSKKIMSVVCRYKWVLDT